LTNDRINIAFWNLDNLFDVEATPIATDFEFTPEKGWTDEVLQKKIENIGKVIRSMHNSEGPDLLGLCEVENKTLLKGPVRTSEGNEIKGLVEIIGRDDYEIAHVDSPDLRGIDACLIYSNKMFELLEIKPYVMNFRYPTRDVFYVKLRVKKNNSELHVFVNHWPSRVLKKGSCEPTDTEFSRFVVGEACSKLVNDLLKISLADLNSKTTEQDFLDNAKLINELEQRWNQNILFMGDFNDDPFDKSITKYLGARPIKNCFYQKLNHEITPPTSEDDPKHHDKTSGLIDYEKYYGSVKTTLEIARVNGEKDKNDKQYYMETKAPLFNCMWKLFPEVFSLYYYKEDSRNLFDQFIISRGILFNSSNLEMQLNTVRVHNDGLTIRDLPEDKFGSNYEKFHITQKDTPYTFEFTNPQNPNGNIRIRKGIVPLSGYSDHYPITGIIKIGG